MTEERIKCPFCAELIKRDAQKCRFCGEWLAEREQPTKGGGPQEDLEAATRDQEEDHKAKEAVEESAEHKPSLEPPRERAESEYMKKRHRFPWLRIILVIAYLGILVALVSSEINARQFLRKARANENANYQAAFDSYRHIIEKFPFSFAVIETQQGLQRLCESHGFEMPRPSWLLAVEDVLGRESNVGEVYLLSFVTWPACAILLFLVFLTRILRPGTTLFALLLVAVAIAGSVAQLSWYGRVLPEAIIPGLMERPVAVYCASYVLLVLTALMTLTATRKRRRRNVSKLTTAKER